MSILSGARRLPYVLGPLVLMVTLAGCPEGNEEHFRRTTRPGIKSDTPSEYNVSKQGMGGGAPQGKREFSKTANAKAEPTPEADAETKPPKRQPPS